MNAAAMRVGCGNPDDVASRGISRLRLEIIQTGKDGTLGVALYGTGRKS
jgi:hypothetical protein